MIFVDLKDKAPKEYRIYLVLIRETFSIKKREAYAEWTDNGFILLETILFNDEYIHGFIKE